MTPRELQVRLADLQKEVTQIEREVRNQAAASVAYREVLHELSEVWEGLDRTIDIADGLANEATH